MRKKGRTLLILALPYLLTIFLPVISVLMLGSVILNNYNEQMIADQQARIHLAFERFMQKIDNVEIMSTSISTSRNMQNYIYANLGNKEHTPLDYYYLKEHLQDFMIDGNVKTTYFYDRRENRIISSQTALSKAEEYFRYSYQLLKETPEETVARLRALPWGSGYEASKPVMTNGSLVSVVEYRMSLPVGNSGNIQGQLVIALDAKKLFSDFIEIQGEGAEFYIYGPGDELIYAGGSRYEMALTLETETALEALSYENEALRGTVLKNDGWKVKFFMPEIIKASISEGMMPWFWLLVVAPILASIVLSVYFTHRNHREIQSVVGLLRGHEEMEDIKPHPIGYQMIREYAGRIVSENSLFREQLSGYAYSRKCAALDKLVRNAYGAKEEAEEALREAEVALQGPCAVLVIRYEGSGYRAWITEDMTVKDFMKNYLESLLDRPHEIFDTSARETVCLMQIAEEENAELVLRDIISSLNVEMVYHYDIEVHLAAGEVAGSLCQAGESYAQAREVISYNETSGGNFCLYSELTALEDVYYYPREFDEKIYNYVVVGRVDAAREIIQRIWQKNFEESGKMLSARAMGMVKGRLRELLLSMTEKFGLSLEREITLLEQEQNIRQCFEMAETAVGIIADAVGAEKKNMQGHSAQRLMQYVQNHFCDNTLSLKSISQAMGITETYISNLFKNAYGENISSYIEKLRIERAGELIKHSDMKIGDIAMSVGYTSDASFRRAFKKITGVAPGEYREG